MAEKPRGRHGGHFDIAFGDPNTMEEMVIKAVREPDARDILVLKTSQGEKHQIFVGRKKINSFLDVTGIVVNGEIISGFPHNTKTIPHQVYNVKIEEWANGLEAWITCGVISAEACFFPVDYYKDKAKYLKEGKKKVKFSALAYSVGKVPKDFKIEGKGGRQHQAGEMSALIPANLKNPNAFPDDHFFQGKVTELSQSGENILFKLAIALNDGDFTAWVYALKERIKEEIKKGDYISGVFWLQGLLA